jgi:hypothetical protein
VDVQARGPVHEAFAEPVQSRPEPSPIVPKAPPKDIDEIPPDQKPAGENVEWIPGYWAWDDEANDFVWVSGCWRVPPPEKHWVPGNWQAVDGGYQWTPGFWIGTTEATVQYLPAPPPSVDEGPSTPAPNANSFYVPGCWIYATDTYRWRPGFWQTAYADWVWTPCHYVWTPAGFVYVNGFWDRPFEYRGLAFAPVRFAATAFAVGFRYVPQYTIATDFLIGSLFVRPSYDHYYFGDYFDAGYARRGYQPWFDYRIGKTTYDPMYAYYRHRYGEQTWEPNLRAYYSARSAGTIARPPRTLSEQARAVETLTRDRYAAVPVDARVHVTHQQNATALVPLNRVQTVGVTGLSALNPQLAGTRAEPAHVIKTEPVPAQIHENVMKSVTQSRAVGIQRQQAEATNLLQGHVPVRAADPPRGIKLDLPQVAVPKPIPPTNPTTASVPAHVNVPPTPKFPAHVEHPIPQHTPPPPSVPPKKKDKDGK